MKTARLILFVLCCYVAIPVNTMAQLAVNRLEYYIDVDPGYGRATPVSIRAGSNVDTAFSINTLPLQNGLHIVGLRSRAETGAWSFDATWLLYKPAMAPAARGIRSVEYYIDVDPGYRRAAEVPSLSPDSLLQVLIEASSLAEGLHLFFVRSEDSAGHWSFDEKWLILKRALNLQSPAMERIEYYVDHDPGFGQGTAVAFLPGAKRIDLPGFVNVSGLDTGHHRMFVRAKDSSGKWSFDDTLSFSITTPVAQPSIVVNSVAFYNQCIPGPLKIGYDVKGAFDIDNRFIAELSDSTGNFSNADSIGSQAGQVSGLMDCVLPPYQLNGSGYRMRVRSTHPAFTSDSSALSLSVDRLFLGKDTVQLFLCADVANGTGHDLTRLLNTANCSVDWTITNPHQAPLGTYRITAVNAIGCSDTALLTIMIDTISWVGTADSNWHNSANWSRNKLPDEKTHVIISGNTPFPCTISNADATAASIKTVNGGVLAVKNNRRVIIRGQCSRLL